MRDLFPQAAKGPETVPQRDNSAALGVREILLALRRRWWLIALGTCLGATLAATIAFRSEPLYTASASLVIEPQAAPIADLASPTPVLALDPVVVKTQINIIRSRQQMAWVMRDLNLLENPAFNPTKRRAQTTATNGAAAWWDATMERLRHGWLVPAGLADALPEKLESAEPTPTQDDMEAALESFSESFVAKQDGESRVINLYFTSPDRKLAADVVNRAAELYLEGQQQSKLEQSEKVSAWVQERIADVTEDVRQAERAVEEYRAQMGTDGTEQPTTPDERPLAALTSEFAAKQGELLELQSKLNLARQLQDRGDTDSMLGLVSSPILASLREQELQLVRREAELKSSYGTRHPQMLLLQTDMAQVAGRIAKEVNRLVLDLGREAELARRRLMQLETHIKERRAQDHMQGMAAVGLREREREAQASRDLLQRFLQHDKEVGDQQALIGPDARIISIARPPEFPSSLSPKLFILVSFVMAFAGSSVLALLLEGMDHRVRSARQLEQLFGYKVLDAVPRLRRGRRKGSARRYLRDRPNSAYANALRSVFTSMQVGSDKAPSQVVLVCSALSGEGKTTFSVDLATVAAGWDRRVLVIDLDLHHPCVAEIAGGWAGAGVFEAVTGAASLEQAIARSRDGFDYLGARRSRNATGLIAGPRMQQLFEELRARYDLILVDSAPLLAVSDGRIAAQLADAVLYLTRWRRTPVSAIRRALQILYDARASVAGLVLLGVKSGEYMYYENEDGANYYRNLKKYYVD